MEETIYLFLCGMDGKKKDSRGDSYYRQKKKINLNLSNKIINKTLKTRQHDLKTHQDRKGEKIPIFIP